MNIDKVGKQAIEAYLQKTPAAGEKSPPPASRDVPKAGSDDVSISSAARDLQEAQKAVQNAPDVRQEKVAAIKKQVQDGTYHVATEALVEKLLSVFKDG